ncbi:HNH endonuclease [Bacillus sp. SM2101]|uniref:HNH endonuclease n=1 Tax=Bacillus sp. SM2101 TaxID=2805366 RepID=UPI001BDEA90A|nr:HNH endonuclease [Bacillus sp. SM2101]
MEKRSDWLKEIITVFKELGGQATLIDIYSLVEERNQIDISIYTDWKAQIRKHIYLNSSDTEVFKGSAGDENDLFYSIKGKGKGYWGIRNYVSVGTDKTEKTKRNPKWKRDELILALSCYFKNSPIHISNKHEDVIKLSQILNGLPIHERRPNKGTFRNPQGVYMKMCNFLRFDPDYKGKGLERGSKLEEEIWNEFYNDKDKLHDIAQSIISGITYEKEVVSKPINIDEEEEFPEGKVLYRVHKQRERNSNVVKKKKQIALENNELKCEICEFDFYKTYGKLGHGFIECHHTIPVSNYKEDSKTKLNDLILVCSNCHRMLHRKRPWLNKVQLKSILNS